MLMERSSPRLFWVCGAPWLSSSVGFGIGFTGFGSFGFLGTDICGAMSSSKSYPGPSESETSRGVSPSLVESESPLGKRVSMNFTAWLVKTLLLVGS